MAVGLMVLILVAARVFYFIEWSWWWVFCPIWIPIGLILMGYLMAVVFMALYNMVTKKYFPEKYKEVKKREAYFRKMKNWGE